jgi:hypothetical protein
MERNEKEEQTRKRKRSILNLSSKSLSVKADRGVRRVSNCIALWKSTNTIISKDPTTSSEYT